MNHLTLYAYEEDGELFVYRCPEESCGSTGPAGSECEAHEPPLEIPYAGVKRKRVRVPGVREEPRYTLEQVSAGLLSDGVLDAVAMALDEEFARETGGEAVTDYALAKRLVTAALDHFTQQFQGTGGGGMSEVRAVELAQGLAGNGGSLDALSVMSDISLSSGPTDGLIVDSGPDLREEHRCPSCGECYPLPGTCWGGYGADHPAAKTERVYV